jgi:hypothetical protein
MDEESGRDGGLIGCSAFRTRAIAGFALFGLPLLLGHVALPCE